MATAGLIIWPTVAALGAAGLYAVAPRRARGLYLAPAASTVALIALAAAYVAAVFR
ncbi:hypothetical protein ACWIID_09155 [Streptomyces phaeochromogenes]